MSDPHLLTFQLPPSMLEAIAELVETRVLERLSELDGTTARRRTDFLSAVEAAELMRCKRQRVYDLASSGRLRRYRDGTRLLVRRTDVEAYLSGSSVASALPPTRVKCSRKVHQFPQSKSAPPSGLR